MKPLNGMIELRRNVITLKTGEKAKRNEDSKLIEPSIGVNLMDITEQLEYKSCFSA